MGNVQPLGKVDAIAHLREVGARCRLLREQLDSANAERDRLIVETAHTVSRREAAAAACVTPGRVQQIIDAAPTTPSD